MVLSSDLGYRPLGRLLLEQGEGVSLLNGAQLLLLSLLELCGVSNLRMEEIGGISVAEDPVPVSGEKKGRGVGLQLDSEPCRAGSPSTITASFTLPQSASPELGYSPLGQSQPCVHSLGDVSGSQPGALSSPETHRKGISG